MQDHDCEPAVVRDGNHGLRSSRSGGSSVPPPASEPGNRFDSIARQLYPLARPVFLAATNQWNERPNVASICRRLGYSARTLQRQFVGVGLPAPRRLITLARWLPAVRIVCDQNLEPRLLARIIGFSSTQSLSKAARRELGMSVSSFRRSNAFDVLAEAVIGEYGGWSRSRVTEDCEILTMSRVSPDREPQT